MTELNITKQIKPLDDMATLATKSRKHLEDNPLLEALTLVIESNAEYARGVTTILDSDLEREVLLAEIKKEVSLTKKIMETHNVAIEQISTRVNTINKTLETLEESISDTITEKLGPLYVAADLQESGAEYNPTDKLVVTGQKVLSSKLFTMLAGVAIWLVVKLLYEGLK